MNKQDILFEIKKTGVVAVIRAETADQAMKIADACHVGGISALEVTFTVPYADEVIRETAKKKNDDIVLGAGTVLDPLTARIAILAGAQYIVSPCYNPQTAELCNRYQIPYLAGAMTVKEIVECMQGGVDIVKLFPGEICGVQMVKAVKGPLPQAQLMPTGGVSLDNVEQWIQAGVVAVGVGGQLTAGAKTGDYQAITDTARAFIEKVRLARAKQED